MDAIDRAIIRHLEQNARLSNLELAERVGLSPSPCLRRVRRLESEGIIKGYHAHIEPSAVERGFQVMVHVTMAVQDEPTLKAFEQRVAKLEEVSECRRMFGHPDYLLWIAVADLETFEKLYVSKLVVLPGVARTNSQFTMKVVKRARSLRG